MPICSRLRREIACIEYTDAVLDALDVDPAAVVCKLLWFPEDTGEPL